MHFWPMTISRFKDQPQDLKIYYLFYIIGVLFRSFPVFFQDSGESILDQLQTPDRFFTKT